MWYLILFCSLFASGFNAAAMDCSSVDSSELFPELLEALTSKFDHPPQQLFYCGGIMSYLWKAEWDVYDTGESWSKKGEASCWVENRRGKQRVFSCRKNIIVSNSQTGDAIDFKHEMSFDRINELVETTRSHIDKKDLITRIEYTKVYGGKSWSAEEYGYKVITTKFNASNERETLHIVRDCSPSPCLWTIKSHDDYITIN